MLPPLDQIKTQLEAVFPEARLEILLNDTPALQPSLVIGREHVLPIARWLRDSSDFQLDYASNVTGVDWLDAVLKEKIKTKKVIEGAEKEVEEIIERERPGYLETVYHLYSIALKHGPLIIRVRTGNRSDDVHLPSLTPIWRSAEFQEREIYDLYGIVFDGHPDLRRLLMWDGFVDHPMRKDYVDPDDYEYEPTPHDEVLEKAKAHQALNCVP